MLMNKGLVQRGIQFTTILCIAIFLFFGMKASAVELQECDAETMDYATTETLNDEVSTSEANECAMTEMPAINNTDESQENTKQVPPLEEEQELVKGEPSEETVAGTEEELKETEGQVLAATTDTDSQVETLAETGNSVIYSAVVGSTIIILVILLGKRPKFHTIFKTNR